MRTLPSRFIVSFMYLIYYIKRLAQRVIFARLIELNEANRFQLNWNQSIFAFVALPHSTFTIIFDCLIIFHVFTSSNIRNKFFPPLCIYLICFFYVFFDVSSNIFFNSLISIFLSYFFYRVIHMQTNIRIEKKTTWCVKNANQVTKVLI